MVPERFQLLQRKLALRQPDLTVLLEGVHKTHNFSAILRSCDAVGVFHAHAVPPPGGLPLSSATAQGAEKWVRVSRHVSFAAARERLREEGFALYGAHLGESAVDFREADFTRPAAVVMGTEKHGLSPQAVTDCDQVITIPMQGMVESLNVSVACALILFEAQRQRLAAGLYAASRLPPEVYRDTLFEWSHPRIARYCRDKGLPYPDLDEEGSVVGAIKGSASNPWP